MPPSMPAEMSFALPRNRGPASPAVMKPRPVQLCAEKSMPGAAVILQTVLNRCGGDPSFAKAVTERFRAQAIIEVERIEKAFVAGDNSEVGRAVRVKKYGSVHVRRCRCGDREAG